ncbi:hypothetical protein N7G274_006050 [Stereocaulon virgatum]|uniref:Uncharacterized protein n=1 Tax=Stereocaulon virgatum TaxID=373712 RepID=A0ABR4A879_9LECA
MSDPEKPKSEPRPESPTTAKALDFDDEPTETPASPLKPTSSSTTPLPVSEEVAPPPKPPPVHRIQSSKQRTRLEKHFQQSMLQSSRQCYERVAGG